jgi:AcrR family transcriptional regulator
MSEQRSKTKKSNSRQRIMETATQLFARRGYHATTVANITHSANITPGGLYWHFRSKSDLLGAVVERLRKEYLHPLAEGVMAAGPRAMERIWWLFKFNARFAMENVDLIHCLRALSLELSPSEDKNAKAFFKILDEQRDIIVRLIEDAQKQGDIRNDLKAEILAAIILAVHDGILLQWTIFRDILDGHELAWAFRQVTLAGMVAQAKVIHPRELFFTSNEVP